MRARSIATGSQVGQGLRARQTNALRSIPGMNLETTQRSTAYPQYDADRHSLRRFGIGKNQRRRRPFTRARRYREVDARAATPTTANGLDLFKLTEVAPRTGARRAEERLDELLLPQVKRAGENGLSTFNQPKLQTVAATVPAARLPRGASGSRRRQRQ